MRNWLGISFVLLLVGIALPFQALAEEGVPSETDLAAGQQAAQPAASRFTTFTGRVDHAAAGCGLRNFDSCTIRLRGIPANSTTVRAFLYWAQICSGTTCPSTVDIEFQGRTITSRLIGTGPQPCWTGSLIGVYQVDVTGLMPATSSTALANKIINGDYHINAIPSHPAERDGRDPWSPGTTNLPKADGATLLVVYSNPALTTGQVHIHHGADSLLGGTFDLSLALSPVAPSPITNAKFTRFGADGQVGSSTSPTTAADDQTFFGGPSTACSSSTTSLTQIAGPGSTINADSDWNGSDGGPLNQLWDTHTTTVTGLLGAGAANYCVRYVAPGDCLTFIGHVLTLR